MKLPPPRRSDKVEPWPTSVWKHCSKCGVGYCLAIGYNAINFDRAKQFETLVNKFCWQVAPKVLCTQCASGVDIRIILEGRELKKDPLSDFEYWRMGLLETFPGKQKYIDFLLNKKTPTLSYPEKK